MDTENVPISYMLCYGHRNCTRIFYVMLDVKSEMGLMLLTLFSVVTAGSYKHGLCYYVQDNRRTTF